MGVADNHPCFYAFGHFLSVPLNSLSLWNMEEIIQIQELNIQTYQNTKVFFREIKVVNFQKLHDFLNDWIFVIFLLDDWMVPEF